MPAVCVVVLAICGTGAAPAHGRIDRYTFRVTMAVSETTSWQLVPDRYGCRVGDGGGQQRVSFSSRPTTVVMLHNARAGRNRGWGFLMPTRPPPDQPAGHPRLRGSSTWTRTGHLVIDDTVCSYQHSTARTDGCGTQHWAASGYIALSPRGFFGFQTDVVLDGFVVLNGNRYGNEPFIAPLPDGTVEQTCPYPAAGLVGADNVGYTWGFPMSARRLLDSRQRRIVVRIPIVEPVSGRSYSPPYAAQASTTFTLTMIRVLPRKRR